MVQIARLMTTVHQIREQIRICRACDLHQVGHGPVPFSGPAPSFLAIVGEAPGRTEDERCEPFVGPSGQLLRDAMNEADLAPDYATFINTVSCFPDRTPNAGEINACATNLQAQLAFTNPVWVVLLGNIALASQRPDLKVTRARGKVIRSPGHRWKFFVTFHPSFALRQARAEAILRSDLHRIGLMMDAEGDDWMQYSDDSCVRCGATPEQLGEHDQHLRFDDWEVPYCSECWGQAPQNLAAGKEARKVERFQERTGALFNSD
jgi:uracil-DNA glycosylase family 4